MGKEQPYRQPAFVPNFTRPDSVSDRFLAYHRALELFVVEIERQLLAMNQQANCHFVANQMNAMIMALDRVKQVQDNASMPG